MPAVRTKLYYWQVHQLSNGFTGLDAKIWNEIAENEEGTVWSEQRARLFYCVVQKRREYEG